MNNKLEEHIKKIADDLNIPVENVSLILPYFQGDNETLESITIKLSGDSKTTKFSNLRFRLKEVLMTLLESAATAPDDTENICKVIFSAMQLIQNIRKLQSYPLSKEEARLLVEMFRLRLDQDAITIDNLNALLSDWGWDQEQLTNHLNNLERLGCISYSEAGVKIEEEVSFD